MQFLDIPLISAPLFGSLQPPVSIFILPPLSCWCHKSANTSRKESEGQPALLGFSYRSLRLQEKLSKMNPNSNTSVNVTLLSSILYFCKVLSQQEEIQTAVRKDPDKIQCFDRKKKSFTIRLKSPMNSAF